MSLSSETNLVRRVGTRHAVATSLSTSSSRSDAPCSPPVMHEAPCISPLRIHHSPPICVAGSGE
ncbi:Uncharacterised protein [Mycobacteroides abscessus subsp. abscessus]|nr:Uncharacterised protein [Mycobacteroides abscessus subsp. abscessus]